MDEKAIVFKPFDNVEDVDSFTNIVVGKRRARLLDSTADIVITEEDLITEERIRETTSEKTFTKLEALAIDHLSRIGLTNPANVEQSVQEIAKYCADQFAFYDQAAGCSTLPHQVDKLLESPNPGPQDNRDCKLPTAMIGTIIQEYAKANSKMIKLSLFANDHVIIDPNSYNPIHPQLVVESYGKDEYNPSSAFLLDFIVVDNPNYVYDSSLGLLGNLHHERVSKLRMSIIDGTKYTKVRDRYLNKLSEKSDRKIMPFDWEGLKMFDEKWVDLFA